MSSFTFKYLSYPFLPIAHILTNIMYPFKPFTRGAGYQKNNYSNQTVNRKKFRAVVQFVKLFEIQKKKKMVQDLKSTRNWF